MRDPICYTFHGLGVQNVPSPGLEPGRPHGARTKVECVCQFHHEGQGRLWRSRGKNARANAVGNQTGNLAPTKPSRASSLKWPKRPSEITSRTPKKGFRKLCAAWPQQSPRRLKAGRSRALWPGCRAAVFAKYPIAFWNAQLAQARPNR